MDFNHTIDFSARCIWFPAPDPIIVGAGPSGLALAACLRFKGVPFINLERDPIIVGAGPSGLAAAACLRSKGVPSLNLERSSCQLPQMPFPKDLPTYPTKHQFIDYLEQCTKEFDIRPILEQKLLSCKFDGNVSRVRTVGEEWVIVATEENADASMPNIEGMEGFGVDLVHTSGYNEGKKEVCLDLCNSNPCPSLVMHILPRDMFGNGRATFVLLKWLPIQMVVDRFLLMVSWFMYGDTTRFGLDPPELKSMTGKTPVFDVGTLDKIKSGDIKAEYKLLKRLGMAFFFAVTTPFGIVLGLALESTYKVNSPRALITEGMLNASSAGLLIYMALVDLLAADFMGPKLQGSITLQIKSFAAVLLGAGGMSLMAKWA